MSKNKHKSPLSSKDSNRRVYKLKHLPANTLFEFLSGGLFFKNMKLVYSGDARCVVSGFKNEGRGEDGETVWRQFEDNCAPDAEVFVLQVGNQEEEEKKEKKKGKENMNDNVVNNQINSINDGVKVKRGRKPKAAMFELPTDKTFTAPELIKSLNLKTHEVSNELNKALKENRVEVVGVLPSKTGRGRSCKVFKAKA
jgi:hypothetical protein